MSEQKNNAVCSICGRPYYKCLSCKELMKLSPWRAFTDTPEHFKIFSIIKGVNTGVYTKREAKRKLRNVDLSDLERLRPNIKEIICDILGHEKVEGSDEEAIIEKLDTVKGAENADDKETDTVIVDYAANGDVAKADESEKQNEFE